MTWEKCYTVLLSLQFKFLLPSKREVSIWYFNSCETKCCVPKISKYSLMLIHSKRWYRKLPEGWHILGELASQEKFVPAYTSRSSVSGRISDLNVHKYLRLYLRKSEIDLKNLYILQAFAVVQGSFMEAPTWAKGEEDGDLAIS